MATRIAACGACILALLPVQVFAQQSSAALARQLTEAMQARQTDSWAARDPNDPSTFVAALYIPGSQLLVVSTPYTAPDSLEYRLTKHEYRQAYVDLQSVAPVKGKFFVQDMAADGFPAEGRDESQVDIVYENGTDRTVMNGDWKAQNLSEADYQQRCAAAEARYAGMLSTLLASMQAAAKTPPAAVVSGERPAKPPR